MSLAASSTEAELWAEYARDRSHAHRTAIAERYIPLVRKMAYRLAESTRFRAEPEELASDGFFGLWSAIDAFEPSRGLLFSTYASKRIRGAMLDAIRERDWMPRRARQRGDECKQLHASQLRNGTKQHYLELAAKPATNTEEFEHLIRGLRREDRRVLRMYFVDGLRGVEISRAIGLSAGRISQMKISAINELRELLAGEPEAKRAQTGRDRHDNPADHADSRDGVVGLDGDGESQPADQCTVRAGEG